MPAAIGIAGAAVGQIVSAKIQSNAAKRAAQAQERTALQGIEYQKGRDTIDDQRYQKRLDLYNQYVADYKARNGGATGGGGGGAASVGVPVSISDLVASQQDAAGAQSAAPPGSIAANVGGWNDWSRYGA